MAERVPRHLTLGPLKKINSVVVFVGGLLENIGQTEMLLAAGTGLRENGYKISILGEDSELALFGFHQYPDHLFQNEYNETEKVYYLNHYVKLIENQEHPDIILVQVPRAMISYNQIVPNGFAFYPFLVSQAVHPDFFICCVPLQFAQGKLIGKMSEEFRYKFGYPIDCVHVSNVLVDSTVIQERKKLEYLYEDMDAVNQRIQMETGSEIPMYNGLNDSGAREMIARLVQALGG